MLSKRTEYAIRALVYIQLKNSADIRPGVSEIAREIEAPVAYSAKILQTLTKKGLLDSMKGRGGGFFFRDKQSDLTLYDVIHVMEGKTGFDKCVFGLKSCDCDYPCPLHEKYTAIRDGYHEIVKTETIQSLTNKIMEGSAVLNQSM